MSSFSVDVQGLETVSAFGKLGRETSLNAVRAINKVARDTRAKAADRIIKQVNLPRSYVSPAGGRLKVVQTANRAKKQATIRARGRATSLARFVTGSAKLYKPGLTVAVQPGQARYLPRAFLVKLRGVGGSTDAGLANTGLAIRLKPGERIHNKRQQIRLSRNLYLLYGPSVAQVFLDNSGKGVADDLAQPTAEALEAEFLRLTKLGLR